MAFRLLGEVGIDGVNDLRPQSTRLLALLLARRGQRVSVDLLEEVVWEGVRVRDRGTIHTAVSRLRARLPSGCLTQHGDGYVLDVSSEGCDADVFEALLASAEAAASLASALQEVERALAMWRGTPFGTFGSESMFASETARLADCHGRALALKCSTLIKLGRPSEAVEGLIVPLAQHPFNDGLRSLYVEGLAACGRRVEALRELDAYKRFLAEETGLHLSATMLGLEQQLLNDHPSGPIPSPNDKRSPADVESTGTLPLGGGLRYSERAKLYRCIAAAISGHPQVVVIHGEAGYGKTTMAQDLRRVARDQGMHVISGRADRALAVPLGCWGSLGREARSEAAVLPVEERRNGFVSGVLSRVDRLLGAGPLALILEDCHWADAVSLEVLAALLAVVEGGHDQLLIVLTTRPAGLDDVTRPELARIIRDPYASCVVLGPLDAADCLQLATSELAGRPSTPLLIALEQASGGSPLLLRLLCDRLVNRGNLQSTPNGWASPDVDTLLIPADLSSPYVLSFRELGADSAECVRVAALLGDSSAIELLSIATRWSPTRVATELREAERLGLLRVEANRAEFDHDLARRSVLNELSGGERQARHAVIAERIQQNVTPGDASAELVELVARQLQQAGILADLNALATWSEVAGDLAAQSTMWREATVHYRTAMRGGTRPDIAGKLGNAQYMALDPGAAATLKSAADFAHVSGDLDTEITVSLQLHRQACQRNVAVEEADVRVDALLSKVTCRVHRLRILAHLAEVAFDRRDPRGQHWVSEAESLLCDEDPPELRFQLAFAAGLIHTEELDFDRAIRNFRVADQITLENRVGEPRIREAQILLVRGQFALAVECLNGDLEESLRTRRFAHELTWLLIIRANAQAAMGASNESAATLAEAMRWVPLSGSPGAKSIANLLCVWMNRASERSAAFEPDDELAMLLAIKPESREATVITTWIRRLERISSSVSFSRLPAIAAYGELVAEHGSPEQRASLKHVFDSMRSLGVDSLLGWPEPISRLGDRIVVALQWSDRI